ncbi:hypothetical protein C8J56DRAFT_772013 [Mycena floridula]|nr:hypothetical protein C8J56DRAFT_772013 [Mycena floridula]
MVTNSIPITKRICIVGAGTAGLTAIKALLDLSEDIRTGWEIIIFEQQDVIGGVWVSDTRVITPPEIPSSGMYPNLITNTPGPMMTFPNYPLPQGTPLYPGSEPVLRYLEQYAEEFDLTKHIKFNHQVLKANWQGTTEQGQWLIEFQHGQVTETSLFDHLIVCSGVNHYPHIPSWPGQSEWLAHPGHEMLHAIWYRDPKKFTNLRVLVVGGAASGIDIANHASTYATETYISLRSEPDPVYGPISRAVHRKGDISHFLDDSVVFVDGSSVKPDIVMLGTGYEKQIPFLESGKILVTAPIPDTSNLPHLVTNLRYIFPLYKHTISLAASYPTNALAFVGLNTAKVGNAMLDMAQSIFLAQAIANDSFLPPREKLLALLAADEQKIRDRGYDPYRIGHILFDDIADDYQDELVEAACPELERKFVEKWRRAILSVPHVRGGWKRLEKLGIQKEWLQGVVTEQDWADLLNRLDSWEKENCQCEDLHSAVHDIAQS